MLLYSFTINNIYNLSEPVHYAGLFARGKTNERWHRDRDDWEKDKLSKRLNYLVENYRLSADQLFASFIQADPTVMINSNHPDKREATHQVAWTNIITPLGVRFPHRDSAKNFLREAIKNKESINVHYEKFNKNGQVERKIHTVTPASFDEARGLLYTELPQTRDHIDYNNYKIFKVSQVVGLDKAWTYRSFTISYVPQQNNKLLIHVYEDEYDFKQNATPTFVMDYNQIKPILLDRGGDEQQLIVFEALYGKELSLTDPRLQEFLKTHVDIPAIETRVEAHRKTIATNGLETALIANVKNALHALLLANPHGLPEPYKRPMV